jgi:hypothetical protein
MNSGAGIPSACGLSVNSSTMNTMTATGIDSIAHMSPTTEPDRLTS